jgi:hypothetical protein
MNGLEAMALIAPMALTLGVLIMKIIGANADERSDS